MKEDSFVNYYEILGLKPNADATQIRSAFMSLAKEHHPDAGGSTEIMQQLTKAYRTLKDGSSKAAYDMMHNFHTGTTQMSDYRYEGKRSAKEISDMSDRQIDDFLDSLYAEYQRAIPKQKLSLLQRILKTFV